MLAPASGKIIAVTAIVACILLSVVCVPRAAAADNGKGTAHDSGANGFSSALVLKQRVREQLPRHAPDRVLVRFRPGTAASVIRQALKDAGGRELGEIPAIGVQVTRVPAGTVQQAVARYRANPNVEFAEPDFYRVLVIPDEGNDPGPAAGGVVAGREYFAEQWGMHNTGQQHTSFDILGNPIQVNGQPDADIDAPEGWDISSGDPSIRIAILDTGIDCDSVEHAGKCVEQISFVADYSDYLDDPGDHVGHGTHVAGIAAVHTDNGIGVAGVGWNSSLGNLKTCFAYQIDLLPPIGYYVTVGVCPVSSSAAAITHAADQGYHVINMSYGSDELDENGDPSGVPLQPNTETAAIEYAWSRGVVLVAAAGNDENTNRVYPAANPHVIAVGATSHSDNLASFSSYSVPGDHWVSLLAPGADILSTNPVADCRFLADLLGFPFDPATEGCLSWKSGTSMASPHVAGAAALVWAHLFPGQAPQSCASPSGAACNEVVRRHLEYGADTAGAIAQNFLSWSEHGRLNVHGALSLVDTDLDGIPNSIDTDDDNDGLADSVEILPGIGTDPLDADSDNDGLSDGFEVNYAPVPPDTYSVGLDTNPLNPDSDGDGYTDADEIGSGSDPLDPGSIPNLADGDLNLDGTVDAADVLLATRIVLGTLTATAEQQLHMDVAPLVGGIPAPDGMLDARDLLLIQRKAAGSIDF